MRKSQFTLYLLRVWESGHIHQLLHNAEGKAGMKLKWRLRCIADSRGADRPEIIAAHSSPVMVEVKDSPFFAAADALTILEQIEGALVFLDTIGTRAPKMPPTGAYACC